MNTLARQFQKITEAIVIQSNSSFCSAECYLLQDLHHFYFVFQCGHLFMRSICQQSLLISNQVSTITNKVRKSSVYCYHLHSFFLYCILQVLVTRFVHFKFIFCSSGLLTRCNLFFNRLLQLQNICTVLTVSLKCQLSSFAASPWASPVCSVGFLCASSSPSARNKDNF